MSALVKNENQIRIKATSAKRDPLGCDLFALSSFDYQRAALVGHLVDRSFRFNQLASSDCHKGSSGWEERAAGIPFQSAERRACSYLGIPGSGRPAKHHEIIV